MVFVGLNILDEDRSESLELIFNGGVRFADLDDQDLKPLDLVDLVFDPFFDRSSR